MEEHNKLYTKQALPGYYVQHREFLYLQYLQDLS